MCHLTATNQTSFIDSTPNEFLHQASEIFKHYRTRVQQFQDPPAQYMHYNWMARGEPLANRHILTGANGLLNKLGELALSEGLRPKFNVSTIMPSSLIKRLEDVFSLITPTIYYSLYSANEDFRAKWLPRAMPVPDALHYLKRYQDHSKKIVKIHYAFIKGQNDSLSDLTEMCDMIDDIGLLCQFNLVRYNPFSPEQGIESDAAIIDQNLGYLSYRFPDKVQMIDRVGPDVAASCGMFVDSNGSI